MNNSRQRFAISCLVVRTLFASLVFVIACCNSRSDATVLLEFEEDGTAVNNSVATAATILPGAFTVDPNPNIFTAAEGGLPGVAVTVSIIGHTGDGDSLDADFYCFTLPDAGPVWLDIDSSGAGDFLLHLFDGSGTFTAVGDDTLIWNGEEFVPDPGSTEYFDSFIGPISLTAGTYYAAVTQFPNFANGANADTATSIGIISSFAPDGPELWTSVDGATVGDDTFIGGSGPQSASADYVLHISTTAIPAVPEPSTLIIMSSTLAVLTLHLRVRCRVSGRRQVREARNATKL